MASRQVFAETQRKAIPQHSKICCYSQKYKARPYINK